MNNGFYIVNNIENITAEEGILQVVMDGNQVKNLDAFYKSCNEGFQFPDYFGENLEAFYELINDLDWLEKKGFYILIKNYDAWMSEDIEDKMMCIEMLYQTAIEWQEVPNYEGEEEYRTATDFRIYIDKNSSILNDLKEMEITEGMYVL
jgi:hypothetical protein